jgi:heme-degrading monooxygenase HmoA
VTDSNPAVAAVVVQWFIKPGREEDFLRDRKPIRRADGFLGEVLFRAVVDTDDPADDNPVVFFTTGYWRSREDFYRKHRHLKPQGQQR